MIGPPTPKLGNRRSIRAFFAFPANKCRGGLALGDDPQQRVLLAQLTDNFVVLVARRLGGGQSLVGVRELGDDRIVRVAQLGVVGLRFRQRFLGRVQLDARLLEFVLRLLQFAAGLGQFRAQLD
jgi:hypothetical protein